jgi:hypothetical protein
MRKMRNAYKVLVHKLEWKRSVHGWKHNITLDLKKIGQIDADSANLGTIRGL